MTKLSVKNSLGTLSAVLSMTLYVMTLVRTKDASVTMPNIGVIWKSTLIVTFGLLAVLLLTPPLIPLEEERFAKWCVIRRRFTKNA